MILGGKELKLVKSVKGGWGGGPSLYKRQCEALQVRQSSQNLEESCSSCFSRHGNETTTVPAQDRERGFQLHFAGANERRLAEARRFEMSTV